MRSPAGARPLATERGGDDWVERVRAASDIVEIVSQTVTLKRTGRNWVGLCPFHQEKTPSFSVHPERQFYHCFSCKAGGDVFKFVQETEKIGFVEAAELLSRRAGIAVPERGTGSRGVRRPVLDALEAAATAYEQWLADPEHGARARAYLERRNLDRDTMRLFRLGVAPAGWEHLVQRLRPRHPEEILIQAGLATRRETGRGAYDRFRNRLMVPLVIPGGDVVGFGARALAAEDEPKYLNSPESPVYHKSVFLFALEQARREVAAGDELIVVEGYFDAITLHQAGFRNTVATSGTALTADHARQLRRVASRVALTYDGDRAGEEATARSLGVLLAEGLEVVVVDLPRGEDPDSVVRAGGQAAWIELRRGASDPIEFLQRHGLRSGGSGDPRERALHAVVRLVAQVRDPIRLRLLLERASQVFGLPVAVVGRAVSLKQSGQTSDQPLRLAVRAQREPQRHVERSLIRALLHDPTALDVARDRIGPEDFADPALARVASWMWSGQDGVPDDEEAAGLMRELSAEAPGTFDWRQEVEGALRNLMMQRLKRRRKEREEQLRRVESSDEATHLLKELDEIARSLRDLSA